MRASVIKLHWTKRSYLFGGDDDLPFVGWFAYRETERDRESKGRRPTTDCGRLTQLIATK